jgi:NADPH:quinone reductase-like Zn-dependent oxidoreductase
LLHEAGDGHAVFRLEVAIRIRRFGHLLTLTDQVLHFTFESALLKNMSVSGFNYGQYIGWGLTDERVHYASEVAQVIQQVLQSVENKSMPNPLTQHFPFSDWKNAIDTTMSRQSVGKVILDF